MGLGRGGDGNRSGDRGSQKKCTLFHPAFCGVGSWAGGGGGKPPHLFLAEGGGGGGRGAGRASQPKWVDHAAENIPAGDE